MTWNRRGRSHPQPLYSLLRTSSWRPSSYTMRMDTRATVPSAAPGIPCSSVRAPTVPGEAGPNFLLLLPKAPPPHLPATWEAVAEGRASGMSLFTNTTATTQPFPLSLCNMVGPGHGHLIHPQLNHCPELHLWWSPCPVLLDIFLFATLTSKCPLPGQLLLHMFFFSEPLKMCVQASKLWKD